MKSDFVDKLLVLVMVLVFPLTIYVSSNFSQNRELDSKQNQLDQESINPQNSQVKGAVSVDNELKIKIDKVEFSSPSAELKVEGQAPGLNMNVMISIVETPKKIKKIIDLNKNASNSAKITNIEIPVQEVVVVAVRTDNRGRFIYAREISLKEIALIDLRFDQNQYSASMQYNLLTNKRTF